MARVREENENDDQKTNSWNGARGVRVAGGRTFAGADSAKATLQLGRRAGRLPHTSAGGGGAKPFDFVEHCHNLGFGVVETRLPGTDPEAVKTLRQKVEGYKMR